MIDFRLTSETEDYRQRIGHFVANYILPLEDDPSSYDEHENIRVELLDGLRARAKAEGLWCIQIPMQFGGQGLDFVSMAACYEEMNRSIFGSVVFNSAAPDDGNMMLLAKVSRPDQQERWLKPIIAGNVRSSIVMTEPMPGSGSDLSSMQTTATRDGNRWIINGRKWFITGAGVAEHFILLARTSDDQRRGLTAFLYHRDDPGWEIVRRIPIMGPEEHGGHCELRFEGLSIPDENRLMEVGDGLRVSQIRLGPARLTHCMRWLGLAKRALGIGMDYAGQRKTGGILLSKHEGVQWMLGETAMAIDVGRLLTMRAAWCLDQGSRSRAQISMAKVMVADTLHKAVDTAIQLNGARGYSNDTVLSWIYRYARQARIVDGASEVHKMILSNTLMDEGMNFWRWDA